MKPVSARAQYNEELVKDLFSAKNARDSVKKVLEARRNSHSSFVAHDGRVLSTVRIVKKRPK